MRIEVDARRLAWLEANNISFHRRFGLRVKSGDIISFHDETDVEPYIGIHAGFVIPSMGFMSYSNSPLPEDIVIGRYCSLAAGLSFPDYRHPIEHVSTSIFTHDRRTDLVVRAIRDNNPSYGQFFSNPQKAHVTIEHDVWIGQRAAIMPGVRIGTGAVIAAHSVVTKDVPPYAIVGGHPASIIRMRFDDTLASDLLQLRWWEYRFTDFQGIDLSNPRQFISDLHAKEGQIRRYTPQRLRLADLADF